MEKKQRKRVGAIRNYKRVSCTLTLSVHRDLKIGDGDGDGNENVKKAIGLISDGNNNFACAAHFFFVHLFAVFARLRRETAKFHVLWRT